MYAEEESALVLKYKDGRTDYLFLADKPVIKFEDETLVIKASDFSADLQEISKFYFEEADREVVAVNSIKEDKKTLVISYLDGQTVRIQGAVSKSGVNVFSVDGKAVKSAVTSDANGVIVNLANQNAGVYIIKANNQSFKITKR